MKHLTSLALTLFSCTALITTIEACKKDPMAHVKEVESALLKGTPLPALPSCEGKDALACAESLSLAMGGKAFNVKVPDQASASAMAILLVRDKRPSIGDDAEPWLIALKNGKGDGVDALRLATGAQLREIVPQVAKAWPKNEELRTFLKLATSAVPGACATYAAMAENTESSLPAAKHWRISACVHRDVTRRDGPGAGFFPDGLTRSAAGARAVLNDTVRALRAGVPNASAPVRAALEELLPPIEQKLDTIRLDLPAAEEDATRAYLGKVHGEVGIELWKLDGGVDAAADTGTVRRLLREAP